MAIVVIGLNHKTAPIAVRERIAFPEKTLHEPLGRWRDVAIAELVILSTCNRVEFYVQTEAPEASYASCVDFVSAYHDIAPSEFTPHLYQWRDAEAVQHLFRVATSLDSLVVGEPQILGQVKAAYRAAQEAGRTGLILTQLFDRAFAVAKTVRTETGISDHAVSVSYAAVELAKKIFEHLHTLTALVLGAGETSELAARHLANQGVKKIFVANRTMARAEQLAQALDAKAVPWELFPEHLVHADIVMSSTSAPQPIIVPAVVQSAMRHRRGRPMFFIDMAVPRDVDPTVNTLENVFVYDLDDLENVVEANRRERQQEAIAADVLVGREVRRFQQWLAGRDAVPTIVALRQHAETIRVVELEKAMARLGALDERQQRVVEALTSAIVNKLLHAPTVYLKRTTSEAQGSEVVQLVRHLFDLNS
jgi:glutamyl-tRNA reductase